MLPARLFDLTDNTPCPRPPPLNGLSCDSRALSPRLALAGGAALAAPSSPESAESQAALQSACCTRSIRRSSSTADSRRQHPPDFAHSCRPAARKKGYGSPPTPSGNVRQFWKLTYYNANEGYHPCTLPHCHLQRWWKRVVDAVVVISVG